MPPLTSSPGCMDCFCLRQKVAELEQRISTLYRIREGEQLIESLVSVDPPVSIAAGKDSTLPLPCSDPAHSQAGVFWSKLGARPKAPVNSTPLQTESWTTVRQSKGPRNGKSFYSILPSRDIQLDNRFNVLDEQDISPRRRGFQSPSLLNTAGKSTGPATRRKPAFPPAVTPAPQSNPSAPATLPQPVTQRTPPSPPPYLGRSAGPNSSPMASHSTTVVIGDSIVRDVKMKSTKTYCFPGLRVQEIVSKIPGIIRDHSHLERLVVHVGTNDIRNQQSELLKLDFIELLKVLERLNCHVYVSGPIPTLGRGIGRFSRLLNLHTWLAATCSDYNVAFIDNFNLFWERREFYWRDGLHPNRAGSRRLTANMSYSLQHLFARPLPSRVREVAHSQLSHSSFACDRSHSV